MQHTVSTVSNTVSRVVSTASTAVRTTASTVTSAVSSAANRDYSAATAVGNTVDRVRNTASTTATRAATALSNLVDDARTSVSEAANSIGTRLGDISARARSLDMGTLTDSADVVTALATYCYFGGYALTGNEDYLRNAEISGTANDVIDVGQFFGSTLPKVLDIGRLDSLADDAVRAVAGGKLSILGKVGAFLAVPLGGLEAYLEGKEWISGTDIFTGEPLDSEERSLSGVRALSGILAALGGTALLVGGIAAVAAAAPVVATAGAVALGVSAVLALGATVYENRNAIGEFLGVGQQPDQVELPPPQVIPTPDLRLTATQTPVAEASRGQSSPEARTSVPDVSITPLVTITPSELEAVVATPVP